MKLRTKIHFFTTLLMLLLLVVMNCGIFFLYQQLSINTESKQLKTRGEELLSALSKIDEAIDPNTILRAYMPTDGAIRVLNTEGKEITSVESSLSFEKNNLKPGANKPFLKSEMDDSPLIMIQSKAIWTDGKVVNIQLLQKLDDVAANQELLQLILIAITVLFVIPILVSNMVLSRLILKPLQRLSTAMKKSRTTGAYEKLEQINSGKDEQAEIERTFNDMMESLETNYKKQQQFVSNASHELKTPITVIESYAKLLLRRGFTNEKVTTEALEAIVNESSRMNAMIIQMLELARNKEYSSLTIEQINITKLLENTLIQMEQAYKRPFEFNGKDEQFIYTDQQKLKQLLFILLDNARKYSDDYITVEISNFNKYLLLSIHDCGIGIPEDQIPHLFDRFFRVGEDRNRKTGGTGLGLAIAKELANSLQIQINVQSKIDVGTTFTLKIPKTIECEEDSK